MAQPGDSVVALVAAEDQPDVDLDVDTPATLQFDPRLVPSPRPTSTTAFVVERQ